MKNNLEQIPDYIFDWMEKTSFSSLSNTQQEEVLKYFSKEEYENLYTTTSRVKNVSSQSVTSAGRKRELMNEFDRTYKKSSENTPFFMQPVALWKAAAILILLGTGWLYSLILFKKDAVPFQMASADTVYVTKEVMLPGERIHDTVYVDKKAGPVHRKRVNDALQQQMQAGVPVISDMNIVSIADLDSLPNVTKRNSMLHDSLLRKYAFVTL